MSSSSLFASTPSSQIKDEDLPSLVLATLVILLLLLAALIWVAFCMAVHRTARRMAVFKRQRRTQTIIAAAISRAVSEGARTADAALSSGSSFTVYGHSVPAGNAVLPSYEEALSMEPAPPAIAIIGGLPPRPLQLTDPPAYARDAKPNRVIRIAPERPGNSSGMLPPSYDYAVASNNLSSDSSSSFPVDTRQPANNSRHNSVV